MKYEGDWDEYRKQLSGLQGRLSKRVFNFMSRIEFHDSEITSISLVNTGLTGVPNRRNPTEVHLHVLHSGGRRYLLRYTGVVAIRLNFDARLKSSVGMDGREYLWDEDRRGFDQWAYDELTKYDDRYLSHEILLQSEATIVLHFERLQYRRVSPVDQSSPLSKSALRKPPHL